MFGNFPNTFKGVKTMNISLTCRRCSHTFSHRIDDDIVIQHCPHCGMTVSRDDENRLNAIAEPICHNISHMNTLIINGIYDESGSEERIHEVSDSTFTNDIRQLSGVYQCAPVGVRSQLASVIDCVYLLVHDAAQHNDTAALQAINQQIRAVWLKRIDDQHREMGKILNIE